MLAKLRDIVEKLQVYPEQMAQNLALTKGLYFSQSILLALTRAGAERKSAYEAVQRAAMKTWKGEGTFAENAKREPEITAKLSSSEIDDLCSLDVHFKHVDATFKALGLE
jgi:adenylosuccinate lyase